MAPANAAKTDAVDVLELRRRLGPLIDRPVVPRTVLARLVGASHGSVLNWERGMPPTGRFLRRLQHLVRRVDSGAMTAADLKVKAAPPRTKGKRRPSRRAKATATKATASTSVVPAPEATDSASPPAGVAVALIREKLGTLLGLDAVPLSTIARLVGSSRTTIQNWIDGAIPAPAFAAKLRELGSELAAGKLTTEDVRQRAGLAQKPAPSPPEAPVAEAPTPPKASASKARREPAPAIDAQGALPTPPSLEPLLYANGVRVAVGAHEARLTFVLTAPGEASPRTVASLLLPKSCLTTIRGHLPD